MKLHNILSMIKGFNAGYCTSCKDKMIIIHEGDTYVVSITKVEDAYDDYYEIADKYLR